MRAEVVAALEEVLDLYEEPDEPRRPQVHFDEMSPHGIIETRQPRPAKPGQPARYDYESARHGTRQLCLLTEPPAGGRPRAVTAHRTMEDFAHPMAGRCTVAGGGGVMRVVRENLKTHKPASLSEAFEPAEARRLLTQRECHDPPKHGRWLHRAASAGSILRRQGLERRIRAEATLQQEMTVEEDTRNAAQATMTWRFTTTEARETLHRLYPSNSK